MSKKMKGVVFDSSCEARVKHQGLLQDYQELQKEAEATRNKLEAMKQRKLTLLEEVSFLRRRCKYLRKNKPLNSQVKELVKPPLMDANLQKNKKKDRSSSKKEATLQNLPLIFNLNQKGRVYMKEIAPAPTIVPILNSNQKNPSRSVKEETPSKKSTPAFNQNHMRKTNRGKEVVPRKIMPATDLEQKSGSVLRNSAPTFDLGQKGSSFSIKEVSVETRPPVFDLNQISMEEEEYQEKSEPRKALVRGVLEEQTQSDKMLSVCRNIVGEASTSRPGKRKISWQDPVALRV